MALLTTNDDCSTPGTVVCFEVASRKTPNELNSGQSTLSFRLATAKSGRIEKGRMTRVQSERFNTQEEFWEWLNWTRHAKMPVWLFGRRIGSGLTLLGIWKRLTNGQLSLHRRVSEDQEIVLNKRNPDKPHKVQSGLLIADDPPTALICYDKSGWRLTCLDILNYLDVSAARLAEMVGVELPETPERSAENEEWFHHCEQRVEMYMRAVTNLSCWHRKQELGRFGLTITSCAMAGFRHRFMMHDIDMPDLQCQRDYEREACYQGRVSCFWAGKIHNGTYTKARDTHAELAIDHRLPKGPFHMVDARSFYGAISAWHEVPVKLESSWGAEDCKDIRLEDLDESCMATVLIESENDSYPVHHNERQLFAYGRFWTTLAGPELQRAVKNGHVAQVGRGCRYITQPTFQAYATALWAERKEAELSGNIMIASVCKQLLARLHGKFQQRNKRWKDLPDRMAPEAWYQWTEIDLETDTIRKMRSIGWDVQTQHEMEDAPICFPAISAWITSWGREWLRDWVRAVGIRQCLYCATDSMIVTDDGLRNLENTGLIQPDILGGLKVVDTASNIEIRGQNNHTFGDKVVISGRYSTAVMVDSKRYHADTYQSIAESIAGHGPDTIGVKREVKSLPISSVDGTIDEFGWITPRYLTINDQREQIGPVTDDYARMRSVRKQVQSYDLWSLASLWQNTEADDWASGIETPANR